MKPDRTARFITDCVHSTGEKITAMQDAATPITRRTFLRYVQPIVMQQIEADLQYDTGNQRGGLRMAADWHVGYYKSTYEGRPCVYFDHSRIEYIFQAPLMPKPRKTADSIWVGVCKRTEDPKLAWIEKRLERMGIPCRRNGFSFHGPILEVLEQDEQRFWDWFRPYDDIADDDPQFL